jgi:Pregnancy-associated plasma protein-A/Secretion system C-terminal sorting domain/Fibronectin type III domain
MTKQTPISLLVVWAFFCQSLFAQTLNEPRRNCATDELHRLYLADDEDYHDRREAIERHVQNYVRNTPSVSNRSVITIPVVVHVIYNNEAQNISDAQVMSQLAVLNQDFRRLNTDKSQVPQEFAGVAADAEIEFCLARRKPDGTPTNGIDRVYTNKNNWGANDDMKRADKGGAASWDGNRYLNIWVCALQGQLGYASFPGAPLSTDGVVIDYRYFGTQNTRAPYHLGRTTTHEVGHWLNLYHIWGDGSCGDDYCSDTPVQQGANYGCPTHPHVRTGCSRLTNEMFMNYMDYTNDGCMYMFTLTQKARMQSLFVQGGARYGIATSTACVAPFLPCLAPTPVQILNVQQTAATFSWTAVNNAYSYTLEYKKTTDATWTVLSNITANAFTISNLDRGTPYQIRIKTVCNNGTESLPSAPVNFQTTVPILIEPKNCDNAFEPNESRLAAKYISPNTPIYGAIHKSRDRDWYALRLNVGNLLRLNLSQLPADYDLRLFDANGGLIGSSENMGLTDENIRFVAQAGHETVYIMVFSYNGTSNSKKCYKLTAQVAASARLEEPVTTVPNATKRQKKEADTEGVKIYPNPTTGSFIAEIEEVNEGRVTVQLLNATGQVVKSEQMWLSPTTNTLKMDIQDLQTGFYLLRIEQDEQVWMKKIVKQ